ncbi:hypothetical protein QBD00_002333 [Ochrobactrum sp. AN78]|nr:hypothetical protein [Ochrobactrum sp. AN78]
MKIINCYLLVAVMVVGTGCVGPAQKNIGITAAECEPAKQNTTFNEKCDPPKLGWKGANGSDFIISQ